MACGVSLLLLASLQECKLRLFNLESVELANGGQQRTQRIPFRKPVRSLLEGPLPVLTLLDFALVKGHSFLSFLIFVFLCFSQNPLLSFYWPVHSVHRTSIGVIFSVSS